MGLHWEYGKFEHPEPFSNGMSTANYKVSLAVFTYTWIGWAVRSTYLAFSYLTEPMVQDCGLAFGTGILSIHPTA